MNLLVLGASDDSLALDTLDILAGVNAGKERIGSSSLPVSSSCCVPRKIHHRTKAAIDDISQSRHILL